MLFADDAYRGGEEKNTYRNENQPEIYESWSEKKRSEDKIIGTTEYYRTNITVVDEDLEQAKQTLFFHAT